MSTANHHLYAVAKEEWGTKGCKSSTIMQALQPLQLVKGTSRDKVTLLSEEMKSVALAVLESCLSEGISE